jgi:type IV secretory pathway TrbD component
MQPTPVAGWHQPIFHSLAQPLLTGGVPSGFFIASMLGAMVLFFVWWPVIVVQAGVYGLARVLTQWEPQWCGILVMHLTYARYYEG